MKLMKFKSKTLTIETQVVQGKTNVVFELKLRIVSCYVLNLLLNIYKYQKTLLLCQVRTNYNIKGEKLNNALIHEYTTNFISCRKISCHFHYHETHQTQTFGYKLLKMLLKPFN